MSNPILIKLGGSLLMHGQGKTLRRLGRALADSGKPILVTPGGGPFADTVRHYGGLLRLKPETCHFMAVSAMDQYAFILHEYIPGSRIIEPDAGAPTACPGAGILLCSQFLRRVPAAELPRSWDVTADSIAAYLAREMRASMLVILKSADISADLTEPGVDAFFRRLLPLTMPVWFVNGTHPERLERLLDTGDTEGLYLPPGATDAREH